MENTYTFLELMTGVLGWQMLFAIMFFGFLGAMYRKTRQFEKRDEYDKPFSLKYWMFHNWRGMVAGAIVQYVYGVFAPWLLIIFSGSIPENMPFEYAIIFAGLLTGYYSSQIGDKIVKDPSTNQ